MRLKQINWNAVGRRPALAIVVCKVAALAHEARDDAVEAGAAEALAGGFQRQLLKVLSGLGGDVVLQLDHNAAQGCALAVAAQLNVEVYLGVCGVGGAQGRGKGDVLLGDRLDIFGLGLSGTHVS